MEGEIPGTEAWEAWTPWEAAHVLADYAGPWAVAAGWSLDLYHGRQTRAHDDLEIAIPRATFAGLKAYLTKEFQIFAVGNGEIVPLTPESEREKRQMWVCDPVARKWRMDIFLEPGDTATWVSHRDQRITMPYARAVQLTADGIPYLAPEIALFAKAKHTREKDETDFARALPTVQRAWLAGAIELVHPGHAWIERCRATS